MKEYLVINDDNTVSIMKLKSDGNLPPDEREDICSIAEVTEDDYYFPAFINEISELGDLSKLDISDYLNLLNIYRKFEK